MINTERLMKEDTRPLEAYYEAPANKFWVLNARHEWHQVDKETLKLLLRKIGRRAFLLKARNADEKTENISQVEDDVLNIVHNYSVSYVGQLAGYDPGEHVVCSNHILVTKGPKRLEPKAGDWDLLRKFLEGLLDSGGTAQSPYFHAWVKHAVEALQARKWMEGRALVLAGPAGCGKSFLQGLITQMLGGRSAKPMSFLAERVTHNWDLFEAEHLVIEDEQTAFGAAARLKIGEGVKGLCVNPTHHCHGKYLKPLSLAPLWRTSMSLNLEGEQISAFPQMDAGTRDKFLILKCEKQDMPMPGDSPEEREASDAAFAATLPGYLHWLLADFTVPAEMKSGNGRYGGVKEFHHPDIMDALTGCSPEENLWELAEQSLAQDKPSEWRGTAVGLQGRLYQDDAVNTQAKQLLSGRTNSTSTYLGRLAKNKEKPGRVTKAPGWTKTHEWILTFPARKRS